MNSGLRVYILGGALGASLLTVVALHAAQPAGRSNGDWSSSHSENRIWSDGSDEGGGASGYLGVDIADITADRLGALKLKEEHGAEITMVDEDAPAGKSGLHEHDVILSVNGTAVESAAQLRRMIKETPAGRAITLGISRDGQPQDIKVQLADRHKAATWDPKSFKFDMPKVSEMPELMMMESPMSVIVVRSARHSGIMVEDLTSQLAQFFGVKDGGGILIRSVEKASSGEKSGFRAGDVIVKVNGQSVHDTSDFSHALRSSSGSASVVVMRGRREETLTLSLPDKKDSGDLQEESFYAPEISRETEEAINKAGDEIAALGAAVEHQAEQALVLRDDNPRKMTDELQAMYLRTMEKKLQESQRTMRQKELDMKKWQEKLNHELAGKSSDI